MINLIIILSFNSKVKDGGKILKYIRDQNEWIIYFPKWMNSFFSVKRRQHSLQCSIFIDIQLH